MDSSLRLDIALTIINNVSTPINADTLTSYINNHFKGSGITSAGILPASGYLYNDSAAYSGHVMGLYINDENELCVRFCGSHLSSTYGVSNSNLSRYNFETVVDKVVKITNLEAGDLG